MKSVGLIISIEHDGRDALILQIRSRGQSWGGACQVTVEGKLEPRECRLGGMGGFERALWREIREELGAPMARWLRGTGLSFTPLSDIHFDGKDLVKFGLRLPINYSEFIDLVIPGSECAGFRLFMRDDEVRELRPEEERQGVPPGDTAMFPDSLYTLAAAFDRLRDEEHQQPCHFDTQAPEAFSHYHE